MNRLGHAEAGQEDLGRVREIARRGEVNRAADSGNGGPKSGRNRNKVCHHVSSLGGDKTKRPPGGVHGRPFVGENRHTISLDCASGIRRVHPQANEHILWHSRRFRRILRRKFEPNPEIRRKLYGTLPLGGWRTPDEDVEGPAVEAAVPAPLRSPSGAVRIGGRRIDSGRSPGVVCLGHARVSVE